MNGDRRSFYYDLMCKSHKRILAKVSLHLYTTIH